MALVIILLIAGLIIGAAWWKADRKLAELVTACVVGILVILLVGWIIIKILVGLLGILVTVLIGAGVGYVVYKTIKKPEPQQP